MVWQGRAGDRSPMPIARDFPRGHAMDVNLGCGHLSDDEFVAAFEEWALSPAAFHQGHLRLAWIYAGR